MLEMLSFPLNSKLLGLAEQCEPDYLTETFIIFIKERSKFRLEKLRSARCSQYVFLKVLPARKTYLITACSCSQK